MASNTRVIWVHTAPLRKTLDAATWLETTFHMRESGAEITLISEGEDGPQNIRGIDVICISKPNIYLLRQFFYHMKVLRLIFANWRKADVVLFHQMSAIWILPLRFVRPFLFSRGKPRLIMDTRTLPMEPAQNASFRVRLRASFHKWMTQLAHRWADGQTAITQRMAEAVGIPDEHLFGVWPSAVNPQLFSAAAPMRHWPAPGEAIHVTYVGSMHPERNLMSLFKAVEQANEEGMCFKVTLVGDGKQRQELFEYAATRQDTLRVLPPVPHSEIPEFLSEMHIGVLAFPDEEKFRVSSPIKLYEYMAAGLAVLATRIVCHTDVVGDGDYTLWAEDATIEGLLVALREAWERQAELSAMGQSAMQAAEDFSWQASANKLLTALEKASA